MTVKRSRTLFVIIVAFCIMLCVVILRHSFNSSNIIHSCPPANQAHTNNWQDFYLKIRENPADTLAEQQFRAQVALLPDDDNARYALAIIERETGNLEQAEVIFKSILAKNKRQAGAFWNLGRLAIQRGDLTQATHCFENAISTSTSAWQPVYALAQVKQMQGLTDEAKRLFEKASSLGSGQADAHGGMGGMKPSKTERIAGLEWD